jgi:hypothetical protein
MTRQKILLAAASLWCARYVTYVYRTAKKERSTIDWLIRIRIQMVLVNDEVHTYIITIVVNIRVTHLSRIE